MLTLYYGLSADSRQALLVEKMKALLTQGKRVIWFVPEQQVLESEGVLAACENSRLGEVTSFGRMANTVFRRFGGLRYHTIGKGAKQLVMWRALNEVSPSLTEYKGVTLDDMATVRLLFDTVEELKLYLVTPEVLDAVADGLEDGKFKNKLRDISLIYAAYAAILNTSADDSSDDVLRAASLSEGQGVFEGAYVFFSGFDGFTPNELLLMRVIFSEAKELFVSLAFRKDDRREFFAKLFDTDRRLRVMANDCHRSVQDVYADEAKDSSYDIRYFQKNYGKRRPEAYEEQGAAEESRIRQIACPGVYEEVRLIAADIKRRVMEGARYRDFAVIARDSDKYLGILDAALEGAGIPYFISQRRDVTAMSTSRMLLSALDIHARFWRREDVVAFMRSGLSPLTVEECDALEEYAEIWRIQGKRWFDDYGWQMNPFGFSAEYNEAAEERLRYLNTLREKLTKPLVKLFSVFEGKASVKEISASLVYFLQDMRIADKVAARASLDASFVGMRDSVEDHLLLYDSLMNAFDELCEVVGDFEVSSYEYAALFRVLLREADMGALPSRMDEVTVGSASLLRKEGIKHVYLMGLSEGEFPKAISDGGCFDNAEKETLLLNGVEISPLLLRRAQDERLYFYRAVTSAKESVMMTYSYGDLSGKEAFPSSAYLDTLSLLGEREEEKYDEIPAEALLYGMPEILEYAILKSYDTEQLTSLLGGQFALTTELTAENEALPSVVTDTLYGDIIHLTQSRTDSFAGCPFAYHCKYTLKLSEGVSGQFDSLDIGNFIHEILEAFFSRFKDQVKDMSDEEAKRALDGILDEFSRRFTRENKSKRFEGLMRRLKRTTELLVMNLLGELRQSEFLPVLFEEPIAYTEDMPIASEDDPRRMSVNVTGKIDRVDLYRVGEDGYLRVVDYKTGNKRFSMAEVELGFQLQLLVYLFAMTQKGRSFAKKLDCEGMLLPAGAVYFSLGAKAISCAKMPEDEALSHSMIEKEIKRSGIFLNMPDVLEAMEKGLQGYYIPITRNKSGEATKGRTTSELATLEEMGALAEKVSDILKSIARAIRTGDAAARPRSAEKSKSPCQYCKMKPICRMRSVDTTEGGDS